MLSWMSRRLRLEPDETLHALVLGTILFALTSSYTLVKTARDSLYLANLPAETLPWVYLGVGVLTLAAAASFGRATRRRSTLETLTGTAMVSAISLAAFAYLFGIDQPWVPVVLYLWVNIYGLLLMSQFWVFANSVSNPREAKRIYGIVGGGGILGGLFGGLAAPGLASVWGLPALMVVAAALLVAGSGTVALGVKHSSLPPSEDQSEGAQTQGHPLKAPYVRWLAIAALCSVVVTGILDYLFKVQVQARHAGPDALASFFGLYYTAVNLASLTMQLFVTRWALQRLGAGWSAAVLPAGLGLGAAITLAVPGFAAVVATRLWDQLSRQSINRAATEMFYFPLEPAVRRRAKNMIDAGLERMGDGLAGVVILLLGVTVGAGLVSISLMILALVAVWIVAWLAVRRLYVSELGRNLRRMNLAAQDVTMPLREASVLNEVNRLLDSGYERIVLHAMELMQEVAPKKLIERLPELLDHTSAAVRARAIELSMKYGVPGLEEKAQAMIEDRAPEVRIAALRARASVDMGGSFDLVESYLDAPDPQLRLTALQCVIEYAPPQFEARVHARIEQMARAGDAATRRAIAEGLGHRAGPSAIHDLLPPLLKDPDVDVRRAALVSAGRLGQRRHTQTLIEALGDRTVHVAARRGLAEYGDRVTGTLADWLIDPTVNLTIRREIPRVLSAIGTQEAMTALFRYREREDVRLSYRVLKAAHQIRIRSDGVRVPRRLVEEDLEHDARSYLFAFVHYRACPIGEPRSAERLLCLALNERMEQALDRMFRRLALLYPPRDIYAAYRGILSENRRQRGNAIEYLDNALTAEHRQIMAPFVEDLGEHALLDHAGRVHGFRFGGYHETLEAILQGDDAWLRACALYVVGARLEHSLSNAVEENLSARNPQIRETARWAHAALAAG